MLYHSNNGRAYSVSSFRPDLRFHRAACRKIKHYLKFYQATATGTLLPAAEVLLLLLQLSHIVLCRSLLCHRRPMFLTISVSWVSAFVPQLYIRYTRINFLATKTAFQTKVEEPTKNFTSEISLVTSLFGENRGWPTFRVI